jgi:hypothetical protein
MAGEWWPIKHECRSETTYILVKNAKQIATE